MKRFLAGLGLAAALAVGCNSSVLTTDATSTSGSGGAGGTTTSSSGGAGGIGGAGGGGFISSSSGSGAGPACGDGSVFVDIEGDVFEHLDALCAPEGFLILGGGPGKPPPPKGPPPPPGPPQPLGGPLAIIGCPGAADQVLNLSAQSDVWPAPGGQPTIQLTHDGVTYLGQGSDGAVITVTLFEPVGGIIEGTFSGMVLPQGVNLPPLKISGKFRVCHRPDVYAV